MTLASRLHDVMAVIASAINTRSPLPGASIYDLAKLNGYQGTQVQFLAAQGAALPSGITGVGGFDTFRSLYGFAIKALTKTRAGLARALSFTDYANIVTIGDSITAGAIASGAPATGANWNAWPSVMNRWLVARGLPDGGNGWVPAASALNATNGWDARWVFVGSWSQNADGFYGNYVSSLAAGVTATFTSDRQGKTVALAYLDSSGPFTYSVDGAAAVTVTPGGTSAVKTISVTVGALATHSIKVTAGNAAATKILAAAVLNTAGVIVSNFGISGSRSQDWLPSLAWNRPLPALLALNPAPDLFIYEPQIVNDFTSSTTPAQCLANVVAIITALRATGADVVLCLVPRPALGWASDAAWTPYRQVVYTAADQFGLPVLDLGERWVDYATAQPLGMMSDTVHPSIRGYADWGRAAADVILP